MSGEDSTSTEHTVICMEVSSPPNSNITIQHKNSQAMMRNFGGDETYMILKEVSSLTDFDKASLWLHESIDFGTAPKDAQILHSFLARSGIHSMWKELVEGDLHGLTGWMEATKTLGMSVDELDMAHGLNALHYAILFRQPDIVEALLTGGARGDCPTRGKLSPLQLALISPAPFLEGITLLTESSFGCTDVDHVIEGSDWGSALDYAVQERLLEAVVLLIQHGASPTHCWRGKTSLERAIDQRNKSVVGAMLGLLQGNGGISCGISKERLKHVKGCTSNSTSPCHGHTPFADLITDLPDIAEMVLNHCVSSKLAPHEEDYQITFDFSLFEDETSSANKCYRGLPCTCFWDVLSWFLSGRQQKDKFTPHDMGMECFEEKMYDSFEKYHHPLYKVMLSNDSRLLKHPVVRALLEVKLKRFGWLLYYSNLLAFLLLVSLLTSFILLLPNPRHPQCLKLREMEVNLSLSDQGNSTLEVQCSSTGLDSHLSLLTSLKGLTLFLAILRILVELCQLYSSKVIGYLQHWVNWLELTQSISTIVFLLSMGPGGTGRCFCPQAWEWEVGVVSLSLSWVVLIVWLQAMHWIGIYVTIMLRILASFVRVAVFGLLLVVAFGLAFYMLFTTPSQDDSAVDAFSSPVRAALAVISLTAGDIDINGLFYPDADSPSNDDPSLSPSSPPSPAAVAPGRQYQELGFTVWLAAVVIMSLLFNNLLVGLAVGEVSSVIEQARITTIKQRIELVLTLEEQLPECVHRQVIQTTPITIHPNAVPSSLYCLKVVLQCFCVCCSAVCFNTNHLRYWLLIFKPASTRQSRRYGEVPRAIEKAQLDSMAKVETETSAFLTKKDIEDLLKELKEDMKYTNCASLSLNQNYY